MKYIGRTYALTIMAVPKTHDLALEVNEMLTPIQPADLEKLSESHSGYRD